MVAVEGVNIIAVLDCCHSGTIFDLPYLYKKAGKVSIENKLTYKSNIITLSGCDDSQTSTDALINNKRQGAMTWALIECVKQVELNKKNNKYNMTWTEVLYLIRDLLKDNSYDQIPQLGFSQKNSYKNDFIL
jgi:hypothetical protein